MSGLVDRITAAVDDHWPSGGGNFCEGCDWGNWKADAPSTWAAHVAERIAEALPASIDVDHLANQRDWSQQTFGPGLRTAGVTDHISKELDEIRSDPTDLAEWVDVIILAFDGAWRTGADPAEIIAAIKEKQARNEARTWPDWRTADPDKAIEHVRVSGWSAVEGEQP